MLPPFVVQNGGSCVVVPLFEYHTSVPPPTSVVLFWQVTPFWASLPAVDAIGMVVAWTVTEVIGEAAHVIVTWPLPPLIVPVLTPEARVAFRRGRRDVAAAAAAGSGRRRRPGRSPRRRRHRRRRRRSSRHRRRRRLRRRPGCSPARRLRLSPKRRVPLLAADPACELNPFRPPVPPTLWLAPVPSEPKFPPAPLAPSAPLVPPPLPPLPPTAPPSPPLPPTPPPPPATITRVASPQARVPHPLELLTRTSDEPPPPEPLPPLKALVPPVPPDASPGFDELTGLPPSDPPNPPTPPVPPDGPPFIPPVELVGLPVPPVPATSICTGCPAVTPSVAVASPPAPPACAPVTGLVYVPPVAPTTVKVADATPLGGLKTSDPTVEYVHEVPLRTPVAPHTDVGGDAGSALAKDPEPARVADDARTAAASTHARLPGRNMATLPVNEAPPTVRPLPRLK